jgi:hypothetical protein
VLVVDPKTEPFSADELAGKPCWVRHVAHKFQEMTYDYEPRSYGLVMLGYSLKPYGSHDPVGDLLFSLIDQAKVVVIEYSPALARASSQVPRILARQDTETVCRFELLLEDEEIRDTPFARRRFIVFRHPLDLS